MLYLSLHLQSTTEFQILGINQLDVHLRKSQIRKQQSDPACVLLYFQLLLSAYLAGQLNSVVCVCFHLHTSVKD